MGETKEYHTKGGVPWQEGEKTIVVDKDGNRGEGVANTKDEATERAYQDLREKRGH